MPELPEVETTRRGIAPWLVGARIREIVIREPRLRFPVPPELADFAGCTVTALTRRAKYLIASVSPARHLLLHLGMSGSLRVCRPAAPLRRHDHVLIALAERGPGKGREIRYHDPRRFGLLLPWSGPALEHPLLCKIGPEPFEPAAAERLIAACRTRRTPIKQVIMDSHVLAGVGNIYANEALFRARIRPTTPAQRVSARRLRLLVEGIRGVLNESIERGGTTLQDFAAPDGAPGYFALDLAVYGREGEPCPACGHPLSHRVLGQRSTYWCPRCQR